MTLQMVFPDLTSARAAYRSQLSRERLFVPTDRALEPGALLTLHIRIEETGGALDVPATVIRLIDSASAVKHQLGDAPGVLVSVPITDALKKPLKALLTGSLKRPPRQTHEKPASTDVGDEVHAFLERIDQTDHYEVLDIKRTASTADVRAACLKLMRAFHPDNYFGRIDSDVQGKLELAYQQVTTAYEVLMDSRKRDEYDISIGNFQGSEGGSSADVKRRRAELEAYKAANAGRIRQAKELFDAALEDEKKGRIKEARAKIKLAMNYDARNPAFARKLKDLA